MVVVVVVVAMVEEAMVEEAMVTADPLTPLVRMGPHPLPLIMAHHVGATDLVRTATLPGVVGGTIVEDTTNWTVHQTLKHYT